MSHWLKRELLGIGTLAMLANTHSEENGAHTLPHMPAVFLSHASPPSHIAADSEFSISALVGSRRFVRRGGKDSIEGFNFGAPLRRTGCHPSWRTRNCQHVRLGLNPSVTISTDFFAYFSQRDPFGTFSERK
jgi:hypothetical protein